MDAQTLIYGFLRQLNCNINNNSATTCLMKCFQKLYSFYIHEQPSLSYFAIIYRFYSILLSICLKIKKYL